MILRGRLLSMDRRARTELSAWSWPASAWLRASSASTPSYAQRLVQPFCYDGCRRCVGVCQSGERLTAELGDVTTDVIEWPKCAHTVRCPAGRWPTLTITTQFAVRDQESGPGRAGVPGGADTGAPRPPPRRPLPRTNPCTRPVRATLPTL